MDSFPKLPEYELERETGGCPFTRIFAARHRAGDFPCEVTTAQPGNIGKALIANAARSGLAVRHPHLIKTLDARIDTETPFVVTEQLAGETLAERLDRAGPLDVRGGLWIARQVAEALHSLHRVGFVHANVSPANVQLINRATAVVCELSAAHRPGTLAILHDLAADWHHFGLLASELFVANDCPTQLRQLIIALLEPRSHDRPNGAIVVSKLIALEGEPSLPRLRHAA